MSPERSIDVQGFLNAHPFSRRQIGIVVLCLFIVLLDGYDTAAIAYIAPSLLTEWGLQRPDLAPVLSAALFGLVAGSLTAGPLSDRIGRRPVLIAAVLVMGAACLASAFAGDLTTLIAWRFITGIALGAAMPTALTLVSEYCPARRRALTTNLVFCGFPLGAALGGFLAAWIIPAFGWRSVLLAGGVAPLLLTLLLLLWLPESARFAVARGKPVEQIRRLLTPISAAAADATRFVVTETAAAVGDSRGAIRLMLSRGYIVGTLMLWIAYFMGLTIFYAMVNWMPVLFRDAGLAPATAALVAALFPLGGIGSLFSGALMDRFDGNRIVAVFFALTGLAFIVIGQIAGQVGMLMVAVLVTGVLMNTAQSSLGALAAAYYPTQARGTGIAWMMGLGRFGGIAGSFLVAVLAGWQLSFSGILTALAVPGFLAAAALWLKQTAGAPQPSAALKAAAAPGRS
ncbi:aromatic acid/H+ symport family MFS transporter (plasmid) [Azospirillum humicireducens]|uniref:Aromatic acid/H+ symport family MFS transporter n=1 Tax=Azospirillum humicireducens TaxID=1226968 RepID=A0A2R4VTX6_9PROT|nr:MFS transporter [Azospirillum humicireducens]AWB07898.1 aromatic acid/H+ symport family MFS transporter [Azospirillum humicireducens]